MRSVAGRSIQPSMRRVLLLSRYGRLGASTRVRSLNYLPYLRELGLCVTVAPFFDDAYLPALYAGRRSRWSDLRYYGRRLTRLLHSNRFDLVWLEYEALPWLPWLLEQQLLPRRIPIVSDHDDAVFHRYDHHRLALVRRCLGRKIDRVMAASHLVVAGNAYLAERARATGARRVEIVPTVVDVEAYQPARPLTRPVTLGWIGMPSTWVRYAKPMLPVLETIIESSNARLRVVGADRQERDSGRFEFLEWSEEKEVEYLQGMDIGLMPLSDDPWSRGKSGYKLIQYMACGLPVIASPVGVNRQIVQHGVNGFLAETETEWRDCLATLIGSSELRQRMGSAGRKKVAAEYSLQVHGPRLAHLMLDAIEPDVPDAVLKSHGEECRT